MNITGVGGNHRGGGAARLRGTRIRLGRKLAADENAAGTEEDARSGRAPERV